MHKFKPIETHAIDGPNARRLRIRWGLDIPTVAGRADIGMQALGKYEKGQIRKVKLIFKLNLCRALRQLVLERAREMVAVLEPVIAADPEAQLFTREAARQRRAEQYGHPIRLEGGDDGAA